MLETLDWIIIIGFLALIVLVGISFTQKASGNLTNFFLGGRNLPWYMAGISMVATTFAADTPLAVTELVGQYGISGNWLWWNLLAGGMLTTFFFASLWRKANIVTEVEFVELRYSGKEAAFLRGFKSLYLGLFMNVLIIGWVNLAMITILEGFFGISRETAFLYTAIGMLIVAIYSSLSGLLGVVVTDIIQFFIAIGGSIVLAALIINSEEIGGIDQLKESLPAGSLNFFPSIESGSSSSEVLAISLASFLAFFGFVWWASWYPGAEPGGGGYIAQRMMSTKDEKHAVYATLFFQIAHYCLRPWPWILVGLSAVVLYSIPSNISSTELRDKVNEVKSEYHLTDEVFTYDLPRLEKEFGDQENGREIISEVDHVARELRHLSTNDESLERAMSYTKDKRYGYVYAMKDFLPTGLIGLLLVSFFAAYMSTISTQLNWGASYVVNDFYARFIDQGASQKALVNISRITTILLMFIGLIVSNFIHSISGVWQFIMECGAGLGLVLILRWYWWRINAWSEISATIAPFIGYAIAHYVLDMEFPYSFFVTVGFTTLVWIVVTFTTKPTKDKVLREFYQRIRPDGFWGAYQSESGQKDKGNILNLLVCWISAVVMTYALLFSMGKLLLHEWMSTLLWVCISILSFIILRVFMKKTRIFS